MKSGEELGNGKTDPGGVDQSFAQPDEARDQAQLKGRGEPVHQLNNRLIEPEPEADEETQQGGAAENGEDGQAEAKRQGQGNFLRGGSLAQLGDSSSSASVWSSLEDCIAPRLPSLPLPALSSLAWALATARHDAPQLWDRLAAATLPAVQAGAISPRSLATLAQAMGSADALSPGACAALHAALLQACGERAGELDGREAANAAWGLACSASGVGRGVTCTPAFRALRARLEGVASEAQCGGLSTAELSQAHQVALLCSVETCESDAAACDLSSEPFETLFTRLLRGGVAHGAGRAAWTAAQQPHRLTASRLQSEVGAALRSLWPHAAMECEHPVGDGGYSLDVAWPAIRAALEVDGPSHHFANSRRPTGATRLKRRLLCAQGWRVATLPFWAWDGAAGEEDRAALLTSALAEAGVQAWELQGSARIVVAAAAEPRAEEDRSSVEAERRAEAVPPGPEERARLLARLKRSGGGPGDLLRMVALARTGGREA